jgi:hypothetical protein
MDLAALSAAEIVVRGNALLRRYRTASEIDALTPPAAMERTVFQDAAGRRNQLQFSVWLAELQPQPDQLALRMEIDPRMVSCGGTRWLIEAINKNGVRTWECEHIWRDAPVDAAERGDWEVRFTQVSEPPPSGEPEPNDPRSITDMIDDVLVAIVAFERDGDLGWADIFADTLQKFRAPEQSEVWLLKGLGEQFLPPVSRRLIHAAITINVFTGMGNWADNFYGPTRQPTLDVLTEKLYLALARGLVAGANSARRVP